MVARPSLDRSLDSGLVSTPKYPIVYQTPRSLADRAVLQSLDPAGAEPLAQTVAGSRRRDASDRSLALTGA